MDCDRFGEKSAIDDVQWLHRVGVLQPGSRPSGWILLIPYSESFFKRMCLRAMVHVEQVNVWEVTKPLTKQHIRKQYIRNH